MSSVSLIILLIAIFPAFSLAAWVWIKVVYADDDLLAFSNINHQEGLL